MKKSTEIILSLVLGLIAMGVGIYMSGSPCT